MPLLPPYPRPPLTLRASAERLFKEGLGYKRVAQELTVNIHIVRDWRREWECGVVKMRPGMAYPTTYVERAREMRAAGASLMDIVKELKVQKRTVMNWVNDIRKP